MTQLQKTLGPVLIWGLGVGYVISGMYFGWNLGLPEGGPYGMLVATGVVTILYVTFVLGYAELACALPKAGGVFVYTSRAFGPHLGFIGGVAQLVEYMLAPPAIAFAIGSYINQTIPSIPIPVIAVAAYVVFTAINIWGMKLSVTFELVLTVVAVIELCVFGSVALPSFSWDNFSADALPHGWGGAFAALPFAMWFYLAIEGIANVAEEAKDVQRDLPRGFLWAMATLVALTAVTLFGAVGAAGWQAVVYPDPANHAVTTDSPLPMAIGHIVSRESPLFVVLTGIGLIGLIASFHGILIAASRAILEFGRARYAPAIVGEINARTKTPVVALLVNLGVGMIALATGKTSDIILIAVFGALTLYSLSSIAVLRLRMREPELPRPYRTPGYPFTPWIALALSLLCIVAMIVRYPTLALVYAAILVGAWVLFLVFVPADRRSSIV
ncbi:MAG TPA: ethanolamine permease [Kofleriaceae bacterium]|nr:ethanolamine permease [Kofleriaceae bacterium]